MTFRLGAASDRGRIREGNEDSYVASGSLAAVADGMGGAQAGEVASATAADELRGLQDGGPWRTDRSAGDALKQAVLWRPTGASARWPPATSRSRAWAPP
jgi:serine/threonine protein phosphatase PrpC